MNLQPATSQLINNEKTAIQYKAAMARAEDSQQYHANEEELTNQMNDIYKNKFYDNVNNDKGGSLVATSSVYGYTSNDNNDVGKLLANRIPKSEPLQ